MSFAVSGPCVAVLTRNQASLTPCTRPTFASQDVYHATLAQVAFAGSAVRAPPRWVCPLAKLARQTLYANPLTRGRFQRIATPRDLGVFGPFLHDRRGQCCQRPR